MRKPREFRDHPVPYLEAKHDGAYRAVCTHIVDGDTYDFTVDLGLFTYPYVSIRLEGLDTAEVYGSKASEEGRVVKQWCEDNLLGKPCLLFTGKDPSTFGRFVARIIVIEPDQSRWDVADALRDAGFEDQP